MTIKTTNYQIKIDPKDWTGIAYFEHVLYGDEKGGMLQFYCNTLINYDGVSEVPEEILDYLEEKGINVDYARI